MEPYGQLAILAVVVAVAVWPLACQGDRIRAELVVGSMLVVVTAGWFSWEPVRGPAVLEAAELDGGQSDGRRRIFKDRLVPRQQIGDEYVSSQACRSCHPGRFSSWHRTFHRTMTQLASPQSVIPSHTGQFDGVVLRSRGRRYDLERRGDEFWVRMVDPDWDRDRRARGLDDTGVNPPVVARRLVMTTGSHHQQTYWVPSRWGNELLQFPWEFHIGEKIWFPTEDAELREESPERYSGHWNSSCIHCHVVAPNPGLNKSLVSKTDNPELFSEVAELGISCEACHGPAARHVAVHRNPVRRLGERFRDGADPTIINPRRLDHVRSSQVCGRCHALKVAHDKDGYLRNRDPYRPGGDLEEHYRMIDFDDPYHQEMIRTGSHLYWNDGSCRLGGREYLGQLASTCYTKGKMSCLSCHAMHGIDPNDQLAAGMRGNRACQQCHPQYAGKGLAAHTHHGAKSSGSRCYNCHMPHTSYALFTAIRNHRIMAPVVAPVRHAAQPNGCNLCHLDKSLGWTSRWMETWYGRPPVELDSEEQTVAAGLLWMMRGDAAQRVIAAWHVGWKPARQASGDDWQAPLLARLLDDTYSAVRWVAWQSLKTLPGFRSLKYNFVGSRSERTRASAEVLRDWRAGRSGALAPLPGTPAGTLDIKWLEELWKRRDQRPVEIPE